jgi:hypothetical protein
VTVRPTSGFASNAKAEQLDAAFAGFGPARGSSLAFHGNKRLTIFLAFALARLRLVIACDHHGPIGAFAAGIPGARNPDAGGIVQQQVLAVPGGVDPLAERLTLVAVGNAPARAAAIRLVNDPSTS